ncbi:MAG: VWA domain-containing protein [Deltaproteobacteria bacterium]|jgi:serine/threonine-protein kinase PpkA|nr:VWA domain-containing protein [Deltaproteobacteria bacterium]
MLKIRFAFWLLVLTLSLSLGSELVWGAAPLLMPGKKTLYQKVITHPGAVRRANVGGPAGAPLVPFSMLYVYERKLENGQPWLLCAGDTMGRELFWLPAELTSDWKQSLVLMFSNRVGRKPVMFFKSKDALIDIASNENIVQELEYLSLDFAELLAKNITPPDSFPVVAMEPDDKTGAVPYNHFYLMPIFNYDEQFESVKLLEVGSIDPAHYPEQVKVREDEEGDEDELGGPRQAPPNDRVTNAIAFVIDTTKSMGPYIDKCLELSSRIYDQIMDAGQGENVALAVVAFRSSISRSPDIEYTTKIISPLRTAMESDEFLDALDQVEEAQASTHSYAEDSLAGLSTAIDKLDWKPYQGRIIFLLTDAGPLPLEDPFNSTPATPDTIYEKAAAKNIKIVPIHIKAPAGRHDHMTAERAYKALSFSGGDSSNYMDIPAPDAKSGAIAFDDTAQLLIDAMDGILFPEPSGQGQKIPPPQKLSPQQRKAVNVGEILGHSILLDYLGSRNKAGAPRVVKSWITDKDLSNLGRKVDPTQTNTVTVGVLLTKNQLSAMAKELQNIVAKAEINMREQSDNFFKSILSASAQISRDPTQFSLTPDTKLGELGVLGEFLEDLPYKSRIMGMTEANWYSMSPGEQDSFVRAIKARLMAYEEYDKDVDNWAKFDKNNDGEWLYRVPLTMLP